MIRKILTVSAIICVSSLLLTGCNRNQNPQQPPLQILEPGPALVTPQQTQQATPQPQPQQPANNQGNAAPTVQYQQPPTITGPVRPMHPEMMPAHPALHPNQSPMNGSVAKPDMNNVPQQLPALPQQTQPQPSVTQ